MLATLFLWTYITLIAFLCGFLWLRLARVDEPFGQASILPLPLLALAGFAGLSGIGAMISLVARLGLLANALILVLAASGAVWQRRTLAAYLHGTLAALRQTHWLTVLAFLATAGVVLLKASGPPDNYDTGLYHAQAIRWMETYPAIPGLGNLADRLAFNSSWLLLSALFSAASLGFPSFHNLNGLLAVLVTAYALGRFGRLLNGELRLSSIAAICLPFLIRRIFSLELSSPGTDLPAALLVWVIVVASLEKLEEQRAARRDAQFWAILILSLFAVTIKLSVLPVLLLPLYFYLQQAASSRRAALAGVAAAAALVFAPWMARSLIQSGYPVYPLWQVNIIRPDWQIPVENTQGAAAWIRSWAKIATNERETVEKMAVQEWAPVWWANLTSLDRQMLLLNVLALIPMVFLITYYVRRKGLNNTLRSPWVVVYLTLLSGILFWFFQAPAPRFGYAFLAMFPVLCLAPFAWYALIRWPGLRRWSAVLALAALLLYQGASAARVVLDPDTILPVLLLPEPYPPVETQANSLDGLMIYTPVSGDQCWYEAFPCAPYIDSGVELRGEQLTDGFRIRQPGDPASP